MGFNRDGVTPTTARLIVDKAYDSDALDQQMDEYGAEIILPNRVNPMQRTQHGMAHRRYKQLW